MNAAIKDQAHVRDLFLRPPNTSRFQPDRVEVTQSHVSLHIEGRAEPPARVPVRPSDSYQGPMSNDEVWPWAPARHGRRRRS